MRLPPFDQSQRFFRGNLHGHSTHSDGQLSPAEVVEFYRSHGYDFTCLSDHLWSDHRFCAETVLDTSDLNSAEFITIPSAELHCRGKAYAADGLWHIVANGLPLDFKVAADNEQVDVMIRRAIDAGAYVTIAHPEWYALSNIEAEAAAHAHGVEILNYSCVIGSGRGSGIAIADGLLNSGHQITFTATDDSHFDMPDAGGGWVMVAADTLDADEIITALKAGRHYSSTGADLKNIALDGQTLIVETSPADHIIISGSGNTAMSVHGEELTRAEFDLSSFKSTFFRITVKDSLGRQAWSNPYFMDNQGKILA